MSSPIVAVLLHRSRSRAMYSTAGQHFIRPFVSVSVDKSSDLSGLFVFNGQVAGWPGERSIQRSCRKETRVKRSSKRDRDPLYSWTSAIDRFAANRINFSTVLSSLCRFYRADCNVVSRHRRQKPRD